MSHLSQDTIIGQAPQLLANEVDNELIILNTHTGKYFVANGTGKKIFQLLSKPQSVSNICQILVQDYHVSSQLCRSDTLSFLEELRGKKLIETVHAPN